MNERESQPELADLLTRVTEEALSPAEFARLGEILRGDPEARRQYVQVMNVHALLHWRERRAGSFAPPAQGLPGEEPMVAAAAKERVPLGELMGLKYWRTHRGQFAALALALTLLLWAGFSVLVLSGLRGGDETTPPPDAALAARVTALHVPEWPAGQEPLKIGSRLTLGERMELAGGYLELTFADGAVVLLEGPAVFVAETHGAGTLESGRLVARVEQKTEIGFSISTPLAQIIDRGTEFGVTVGQEGETEIEVFEGRVEATPRGKARTPRSHPIQLTQGQAARIVPGEAQFAASESSDYLRELPEGEGTPVRLAATNWRQMKMASVSDGAEEISVYALTVSHSENSLVAFDVSEYYGATALGPGTMTFIVEGGSGIRTPGAFKIELRQLNRHNGAIDLDAASSHFLDGSSVRWKNNSGGDIENLGYPLSVLDITSGLLSSQRGPFGGDSAETSPAPGTRIVFRIPQATLQSWLDRTAPPIVVIGAQRDDSDPAAPQVEIYLFKKSPSHPTPFLSFNVKRREDSSATAEGPGR